jgi:hypothetical protein
MVLLRLNELRYVSFHYVLWVEASILRYSSKMFNAILTTSPPKVSDSASEFNKSEGAKHVQALRFASCLARRIVSIAALVLSQFSGRFIVFLFGQIAFYLEIRALFTAEHREPTINFFG